MIAASGLKYVGVGTTALGWILCAILFCAGVAVWLAYIRPRQRGAEIDSSGSSPSPEPAEPAEPVAAD